MTHRHRLVIADDHAMMRDTLTKWLEDHDDMEVVAAVSDADAAVEAAIREKPDIVLMDIDMPGLGCFAAAKSISAQCRDTSIIFVSAFFHDRYIEQALTVEAAGSNGVPLLCEQCPVAQARRGTAPKPYIVILPRRQTNRGSSPESAPAKGGLP